MANITHNPLCFGGFIVIMPVHALNGQRLPTISLATEDITLITSGNHTETISFYILDTPLAPIVLGHPWLTRHNPKVDWQLKSVSAWSSYCHKSCLVSACPSVSVPVFQEKAVDLSNVPTEYLDLKEVFSKSRAASLPPHRPYDCAIELLPGYIISVEGMRMDPEKVKAVVDWPSPDSRKALLRFLGFANFYRRFIRNFSQLAAPLTALTSPRTTFRWSDAAEAAFAKLKGCFVSAPILITPDPSRQFMVEVDASEVGVGAVLSQRSPSDDKMHPCAFLSHRLSPAERNYDIGNRELLAVKLALEEWRHWLEGSGVPFIVWTDHKNLEYIRTAKLQTGSMLIIEQMIYNMKRILEDFLGGKALKKCTTSNPALSNGNGSSSSPVSVHSSGSSSSPASALSSGSSSSPVSALSSVSSSSSPASALSSVSSSVSSSSPASALSSVSSSSISPQQW
ncbi:uncharacterized protein LOC143754001 [Siphateles boraxobius]|uniref:uncharacterized protein LOC143754001 n=1 Tax=Siphateles boraxobius TaxID=180520 RepID=UPI0040643906